MAQMEALACLHLLRLLWQIWKSQYKGNKKKIKKNIFFGTTLNEIH